MTSLPLHAQVAEELRQQIRDGEWPPGTPIPSEVRLSEHFKASRGTIRTALAALRREGLIYGGRGHSPVVRDTTVGQSFETLMSFTAWAEQCGLTPGQRTVEMARRAASPTAAEALGLEPGTPAIDILRVRTLDGQPVMLERSTYVEQVGRRLFDIDPDKASLYASLAEFGIELHAARHTLDAIPADETDADLLEVKLGAPLLRQRRRTTAPDGTPIEYADDRYRSDRITFTIDTMRAATTGGITDLAMVRELR